MSVQPKTLTISGDFIPAETSTAGLLGEYMTADQLAAELGVTVLTVRRWAALRTGPPITRVGRKVLYRRQAVQKWLLKQEVTA